MEAAIEKGGLHRGMAMKVRSHRPEADLEFQTSVRTFQLEPTGSAVWMTCESNPDCGLLVTPHIYVELPFRGGYLGAGYFV
jgi:hypothetical protein